MALPSFTLNNETIKNSHGFFLHNAAGRLDRFRENPVLLDDHDSKSLIGRWKNLRIEGSELRADPEFDDQIELGLQRKGQVERGYLKGASPGIYIHAAEYRLNPASGEMDLHVTDWELVEASITPIPSNAGALALRIYDQKNEPVPDDQVQMHLDQVVKLSNNHQTITNMSNIQNPPGNPPKTIALTSAAIVALGLADGADGNAISAAIEQLHQKNQAAQTELTSLQAEVKRMNEKRIDDHVKALKAAGKMVAAQESHFRTLASDNLESALAIFEPIPERTSLSAQLQGVVGGTTIPAERQSWNLHRWMKEDMDGLNRLKAEDPETYQKILQKV